MTPNDDFGMALSRITPKISKCINPLHDEWVRGPPTPATLYMNGTITRPAGNPPTECGWEMNVMPSPITHPRATNYSGPVCNACVRRALGE